MSSSTCCQWWILLRCF
uniref:Uncharacterized protein n=1 Tax=Anguilla anguilla TaxID=7936 RepID=A0A0E9UYW1_ANGAN